MEYRAASSFTGGHSDDVDYVSWNPTHPELFCTSSQKDRRIVFWDARRGYQHPSIYSMTILMHTFLQLESRYTQQILLRAAPLQTNYSPDGRTIMYTTSTNWLHFLELGKEHEGAKEQWDIVERDVPSVSSS